MKKKQLSPDTSPLKLVAKDLVVLRKVFRETLKHYANRVDSDIEGVRAAVKDVEAGKKVSSSHFRDARDMITILRKTDVKADKGRRRDLKKLESLVEDLRELTQNW